MPADLELVRKVAADANHLAVVATTRKDGTVHASLVNAGVIDDPVTGEPSIGMVVGGSAVKLPHVRRTGRAAATFQAGFMWVTVEGPVRVAGPDDLDGGVAAAAIQEVLRDVFKAAGGSHDDWDEYDRVMAAEGRTAIFIFPQRIISNG